MTRPPQRRETDGWFGWLTRIWDWIDNRDIDKYAVTFVILYGTKTTMEWSFHFADKSPLPGMEIAAIIAAVCAPYMALQAAAIKWYFESRQQNNGGAP